MTKYLMIKDAIHNININITLPGAAWNILPLTIFFCFMATISQLKVNFKKLSLEPCMDVLS